jgi:ribosome maturation factor RimP
MQSISMSRIGLLGCAALVAVAVAAPAGYAQERGEEVVGTIIQADNNNLVVKRETGPDVRVTITPSTVVEFRDRGDKKLFPNPTYRDVRTGMGVRFVYGTGTLDRIVVHYVPSSTESAAQPAGSEQVKARITSVSRGGREIRADVAGTQRTYTVENGTASVRRGDLVVLTLEDRAGVRVVTRIDRAEMVGTVTRVDSRSITIDVDGQERSYSVDDDDLLDNIRTGQRVRFEIEERSGGRSVVTAIRRN